MKSFGRTIRDERIKAGLTLKACANRIGVSVAYWSDVEHGRRKPFAEEHLAKVARLLNLNLSQLRLAAKKFRTTVKIDLASISNDRRADLALDLSRLIKELSDADVEDMITILARRKKA